MKKRLQLLALLLLLILPTIANAAVCEVDDVKVVLRNNLYIKFISPQTGPITLDELKDLLVFYLSIDKEALTVDCDTQGPRTSTPISAIINKGETADTIPTCADFTVFTVTSF